MLLIDSVYVNTGGGLVLLDLLLKEMVETRASMTLIYDKRVSLKYLDKWLNGTCIMGIALSNELDRYRWYRANAEIITKIFCFGNVPPPIFINACVYVYFHQPNFVYIPKQYSFWRRCHVRLKMGYINYLSKNVTSWFVQTEYIKKGLQVRHRFNDVRILPFFENLEPIGSNKLPNTFIYISSGAIHKNHLNLLKAFKLYFRDFGVGKLYLTIDRESFPFLAESIDRLVEEGIPVENLGNVERTELMRIADEIETFIFPSLNESFGLGLVEGLQLGARIVASDLAYTHEVVIADELFDPYSVKSIYDAMVRNSKRVTTNSRIVIRNDMDLLIKKLLIND